MHLILSCNWLFTISPVTRAKRCRQKAVEVLSGLKNIIYAQFDIKEFCLVIKSTRQAHRTLAFESLYVKEERGAGSIIWKSAAQRPVKRSKTNLRKQTTVIRPNCSWTNRKGVKIEFGHQLVSWCLEFCVRPTPFAHTVDNFKSLASKTLPWTRWEAKSREKLCEHYYEMMSFRKRLYLIMFD